MSQLPCDMESLSTSWEWVPLGRGAIISHRLLAAMQYPERSAAVWEYYYRDGVARHRATTSGAAAKSTCSRMTSVA